MFSWLSQLGLAALIIVAVLATIRAMMKYNPDDETEDEFSDRQW